MMKIVVLQVYKASNEDPVESERLVVGGSTQPKPAEFRMRGSLQLESLLHAKLGGFPKIGVPTILENQMEKKMENEMETGII